MRKITIMHDRWMTDEQRKQAIDRANDIYEMRRNQKKKYKEIGRKYGISPSRARQIYKWANRAITGDLRGCG